MLRSCVVGAAVVASCAPFAGAQITEEDDLVFGPGSITRDAGQDLDFLDVTLSQNRSYNDIAGQFGPGGDFEDWRHATQDEVIGLINNWGFSPSVTPFDPGVSSALVTADGMSNQVTGLIDLLGVTLPSNSGFLTDGITSSLLTNGEVRRIIIIDRNETPDEIRGVSRDVDAPFSPVGHYLVRDVPAPGALALFGTAALAGVRRRR